MTSCGTRQLSPRVAVAGLVAATVLLSACSSSDADPAVKRARAKVTLEERAVATAQSEATAAAEAFCGTSKTYIVSLDRYGDVLTATSPTVGDVKDAGADLTQPRTDTTQAAEAAVAAHEKLVSAQRELTDARSALREVQASAGASGSAAPSAGPSTTPPPPLPSADTVTRVKQAESDFAEADTAITDQTPLTQASQQFNAAAVALEMSWLALYADAGCLTDDQQKQAEAAVADYTRTIQKALSEAGYYQGQVDGVYGPQTVSAIEAVQRAHSLPVTGTVDKATAAALESDLQAKGGAQAQAAVASTAAVQQTLRLAGFWDGPIDGRWTPELTDALKSFQTELGVTPTGAVDAATVAALEKAIAAGQKPDATPSASAPASAPTTTTPTPTRSPTTATASPTP